MDKNERTLHEVLWRGITTFETVGWIMFNTGVTLFPLTLSSSLARRVILQPIILQ